MNPTLRFNGSIRAAGKTRKLQILAYSGSPMFVEGFGQLVIDLAGLQIPAAVPILADHANHLGAILGSGAPVISQGKLTVTAVLGTTEAAAQVLTMLEGGTSLQASVGANPLSTRQLAPGERVAVNGQSIVAGEHGLLLVEKSELKEISVVPAGADSGTRVLIAAAAARKVKASMQSFEEWVSSLGLDAATIGDATKAELQKIYDSWIKQTGEPTAAAAAATVAIQAERTRAAQVATIVDDYPTLRAKAQAEAWSVERAQAETLAAIRASRPSGGIGFYVPRDHATSSNHLTAAIAARAGYAKAAEQKYGPAVMEQSKRLHAASLVDLCAHALRTDGRDVPHERNAMIRAAFSTGSMPVALGDSANLVLVSAYQMAPAFWRSIAAVKSAANFQTQTAIRPNFARDMEELPADGEIKHSTFEEETYEWSVSTYAQMLQISRKHIINDDVGVFNEVMPGLGRAAARKLNSLVATTILANAGSFFSASNTPPNYFTGAATNLQSSSLTTAVQMLRKMEDAEGNLLDLEPAVLLAPPELETTARELLQSAEILRVSTDKLPTGNAHQNLAALVVEPRLSDSGYTGYSTTAWYLFSPPANASVVVGFLNGQENPTVESFGLDHDVNVLAMSFRCFHDFGVSLGDWRAVIKSKGAA